MSTSLITTCQRCYKSRKTRSRGMWLLWLWHHVILSAFFQWNRRRNETHRKTDSSSSWWRK